MALPVGMLTRKLSDSRVRALRKMRAQKRLCWAELGRIFGIDRRYVYMICVGLVREEAGGPIEMESTPPSSKVELRCEGCGGKITELPCHLCKTVKSPRLRLRESEQGMRPGDPTQEMIRERCLQIRMARSAA